MFKDKRVIDLTRTLEPGKEPFKLAVKTYFVEELLPQFYREKDDWYILQEWELSSHIGTHIESPYHHMKEGTNVAGISLDTVMGEAVVLDFRNRKPDECIELADLLELRAGIQPGDIVLINTGYDREYGKPNYGRPYISQEIIDWLVEKPIACLGIDASGIEKYKAQSQPSHKKLFSANIPIIEELTNLDALHQGRFNFIGLPLPIKGADACPIRAIAFEDAEF